MAVRRSYSGARSGPSAPLQLPYDQRSSAEIGGMVAAALAERDVEIRRLQAEVRRLEAELEKASTASAVVRPPPDPEKRAYRPKEAMAALGVSRTKLWRLIKDGQLQAVRLGGTTLILTASIDRLIAESA